MKITVDILKQICPYAKKENLLSYIGSFDTILPKYDINTPIRVRHFIAQVAHESSSFNKNLENLNYSPKGLLKTFPKLFNEEEAEKYCFKPQSIANRVYANRYGNGNEASGDGWKYRGRGLIMITFHDNYKQLGLGIGKDLITHPELLEVPYLSLESACFYWKSRGLNELADKDLTVNITRKINAACLGINERTAFYNKAKLYITE